MKILLYLYYFLRSAWLRGLFNTIRLLRAEFKYEKMFGINTARISPSDSDRFYHYQGAPYLSLMKIFKELPDHVKQYEFIDVGSGKGRVAFVAEYCGFSKVTGIELQKELVEEANANLKTYKFKRAASQINFIQANALEFNYPKGPAVYFFFNPFNEEVMEKVLDRILKQCGRRGVIAENPPLGIHTHTETWFIYMNPQHQTPFMDRKMKIDKVVKTFVYVEAVIFRSV